MLKPYELLENILLDIENGIKDNINSSALSKKYGFSEGHLCRLFRFAFKQSLASYIRSRKLASSIDDLLNTGLNVLDIALDYDFEYEQSYIRSFRREYGITPGDLRKTGKILKITPPLNLFDSQKCLDGIMFGPEIVIVPQFHAIGKIVRIPCRDVLSITCTSDDYIEKYELKKIKNTVNLRDFVYISRTAGEDADYSFAMPAIQVKALEHIPEGFDPFTFETSICAKFRFIGRNIGELNMHCGDEMFKAIDDFMDDKDQKYFLERKKININKVDISYKKEGYLIWEWFAPVIKKTLLKFPSFIPSGIKKIFKQKLPALRFIGKKYDEAPDPQNILCLLDNWQINNIFNNIEKQSDIDYKTFFEGGDAYISLIREKDGAFEHWMGMFVPEGTEIPQGYEMIDFPRMTIGVCRAYGKRSEIINYEAECR
ncbi:MAG: helix-turn-helix domain-containing protein, partial [Treponema sp.]|nr:helix-turn-helix domain-containing protein [Treponema sp.]